MLWAVLGVLVVGGLFALYRFLMWGITGAPAERPDDGSGPVPLTIAPFGIIPVTGDYRLDAQAALNAWSAGLLAVQAHGDAARADFNLYTNPAWTAGVEAALSAVEAAADAMRALPPAPPEYAAASEAIGQLAGSSDAAVEDMRASLSGDPEASGRVQLHLNQAAGAFQFAQQALLGVP